MALHWQSQLHLGDSPLECLARAPVKPADLSALRAWQAGRIGFASLSRSCRELLQVFFNAIHPGEISDHPPFRQRDALVRYQPSVRTGGNRVVVDSYLRLATAAVETESCVLQVKNDRRGVVVRVRRGKAIRSVTARAAIVAAPAPVARSLIVRLAGPADRFLRRVAYGSFTAVTLAVRCRVDPPFSSLAVAGADPAVVYSQPRPSGDREWAIFTVYYADRATRRLARHSLARVGRRTVHMWKALGLGDSLGAHPRVVDVTRWALAGTTRSYASAASRPIVVAGPSVAIAGDYCCPSFPYGMTSAVESGRRAAQSVRGWLTD